MLRTLVGANARSGNLTTCHRRRTTNPSETFLFLAALAETSGKPPDAARRKNAMHAATRDDDAPVTAKADQSSPTDRKRATLIANHSAAKKSDNMRHDLAQKTDIERVPSRTDQLPSLPCMTDGEHTCKVAALARRKFNNHFLLHPNKFRQESQFPCPIPRVSRKSLT